MFTNKELLDAAKSGDRNDFRATFNSIMIEKVKEIVDDKRADIGRRMMDESVNDDIAKKEHDDAVKLSRRKLSNGDTTANAIISDTDIGEIDDNGRISYHKEKIKDADIVKA